MGFHLRYYTPSSSLFTFIGLHFSWANALSPCSSSPQWNRSLVLSHLESARLRLAQEPYYSITVSDHSFITMRQSLMPSQSPYSCVSIYLQCTSRGVLVLHTTALVLIFLVIVFLCCEMLSLVAPTAALQVQLYANTMTIKAFNFLSDLKDLLSLLFTMQFTYRRPDRSPCIFPF